MQKQKTLEISDRIELFGGYDYDPLFLKDPPADKRTGTVINFIAGQNKSKATVVRLDDRIKGNNISGDIAVLELRYGDQTWSDPSPVHIELCDFVPEDKPWKDRRQGEWIEAAATLRIIE
jgi:hypothetical protein